MDSVWWALLAVTGGVVWAFSIHVAAIMSTTFVVGKSYMFMTHVIIVPFDVKSTLSRAPVYYLRDCFVNLWNLSCRPILIDLTVRTAPIDRG